MTRFVVSQIVCTIEHMKRRNMFFTERQWQALKERAKELEIPVSELVRRIIDEYLGATPK